MIRNKLMDIGYTDKQVDEILSNYALSRLNKRKVNKLVLGVLNFLREYGYNDEDIIKMTKLHSQIYGYSVNNLKQKISFMETLGFSKLSIIKMTRSCPQIYSLSVDSINEKIHTIITLGYGFNDVILMLYRFPQLFTLSNEYIINKFNDLISLGYKSCDVIKITGRLPQIWSLTIDNISLKKEFYDSIGISNLLLDNANFYMQSVELSYARYMFLKNRGIELDINNWRLLFDGQQHFINRFGVSNKELVEVYPYDRTVYLKKNK